MAEAKLSCAFYRNSQGKEPVREWLRSLNKEDRQEIGSDIRTIQRTGSLARPTVGAFGRGLYEVRTNSSGKAYRVFFSLRGKTIVLLHGFMKKTQKTPVREIETARLRHTQIEMET